MKSRIVVRTLAAVAMFAAPLLAAAAERRTLPDGSIVELRSGARISVEFSQKSRSVMLEAGDADFWVTKHPSRPFVVRTGSVEVRAVGTAFSVSRDNHKVGVVVIEGRVSVAKSFRSSPSSGVLLEDPIAYVQPGSPVLFFDFDSTPLAEAIALINQHAGARLVSRDASLAKLRISVTMLADDLESFLRVLRDDFGIEAQRQGSEISLMKG
jgi:transmembrane sensor